MLAMPALACKDSDKQSEEADAQLDASVADDTEKQPFSFFVTSLAAMQRLSNSKDGFGGDLRFGETGPGAGLRGADKICRTIAEDSMPGAGKKEWRAFLSTVHGGKDDGPVHAAGRIGKGPWYDRIGRLVSMNLGELIQQRPAAHDDIKNDLPNEFGVPNHNPDGSGEVDNHDTLTGSNDKGELFAADPHATCDDWTKSEADAADAPRVGHSWPRSFGDFGGGMGMGGFGRRPPGSGDGGIPPGPPRGGFPGFGDGGVPPGAPPGGFPGFGDLGAGDMANWMSALNEAGCGASAKVVENGPPWESDPTVGSGGGYGGIYCFALTP